MARWKTIVVTLLALTAVSKLLSLIHPSLLLLQEDSVFNTNLFSVVAGACAAEFALCLCICFLFNNLSGACSVFLFAVAVLTYRSIADLNGQTFCPCLGNVVQWWPWLGQREGPVLTVVAVWLLLTSAFYLVHGCERK